MARAAINNTLYGISNDTTHVFVLKVESSQVSKLTEQKIPAEHIVTHSKKGTITGIVRS